MFIQQPQGNAFKMPYQKQRETTMTKVKNINMQVQKWNKTITSKTRLDY